VVDVAVLDLGKVQESVSDGDMRTGIRDGWDRGFWGKVGVCEREIRAGAEAERVLPIHVGPRAQVGPSQGRLRSTPPGYTQVPASATLARPARARHHDGPSPHSTPLRKETLPRRKKNKQEIAHSPPRPRA
jgi:hypothetical protein